MDRRQAFADYENVDFTWSVNWFLRKGLVHDFGKNFRFLYCSFLSKIKWEIVCGNVVIENKPFQTTAIWILHVHQIGFFLRG